jgi:hypothetical protein
MVKEANGQLWKMHDDHSTKAPLKYSKAMKTTLSNTMFLFQEYIHDYS